MFMVAYYIQWQGLPVMAGPDLKPCAVLNGSMRYYCRSNFLLLLLQFVKIAVVKYPQVFFDLLIFQSEKIANLCGSAQFLDLYNAEITEFLRDGFIYHKRQAFLANIAGRGHHCAVRMDKGKQGLVIVNKADLV